VGDGLLLRLENALTRATSDATLATVEPMRVEPAIARARRAGRTPAVVAGDLSLVRPLGWAGIPIVSVVTEPDAAVLRSRYVDGHCFVPGFLPHEQARTARALLRLGERLTSELGERVPLFYGQDGQLELLYRHRPQLEAHFLFTLNDESLAWALHDKSLFFPRCVDAGVRAPRTVVPTPGEDLSRALDELRPPLVVKPRTKNDWKPIQRALFEGKAKARIFESAAELLAHPRFAELADLVVVQELIEGPVTALYSFHGFATPDGRLLASFSGRKLRTYPPVAGESAFIELVHDPEIDAFGRDAVARLGIRGPFKLDLIRDARSLEVYLLEVNARFNLWHHLGAANGVNLPLLAYEYLCHGRVPLEPPRYGVRARWVDFYRDLQHHREDRGLSTPRWLASLAFGHAVHETFAWDDPMPFVAWLRHMSRARAARAA
jgi:predicted ATP-grasp superfamily ATP-dependent carboligase